MDITEIFKEKARNNPKTIVLPEGDEPRIVKAAAQIEKEKLAELVILGEEEKIREAAAKKGVSLEKSEIINPAQSDLIEEFTESFYELRQHKGISKEEARKAVTDPLYFGTMMVYSDKADGMVAGSRNATGDVLRPGFQTIKTKPGVSVVSGAMLIKVPGSDLGHNGIFIFADCAVNPNPDARQLAEIALCSAETAKMLPEIEPEVALLSFSTKGSAQHEFVDKVREAVDIAKNEAPKVSIDGELQADAALIEEVAAQKSPESSVAGKANVLVFPDLQSGNIGYKLVQRLANAEAIGPILQGMAKPVNDLSQGCSVNDIVNVVAITASQSKDSKC